MLCCLQLVLLMLYKPHHLQCCLCSPGCHITYTSCLHCLQGRLIVYYENNFFRSAARHADVPEMTPQQAAAIEAFDALADSDELRMDYVLQAGDIQLLHNHSIVHARTEYTDFDAVSVLCSL